MTRDELMFLSVVFVAGFLGAFGATLLVLESVRVCVM